MLDIRRREFMTLLAGAVWPLAAGAQQPAKTVVGYLIPGTTGQGAHLLPLLRQILAEAGYVEGRNLTIEYLCVPKTQSRTYW
jgi:putative ABC transport system substrate-binding protein